MQLVRKSRKKGGSMRGVLVVGVWGIMLIGLFILGSSFYKVIFGMTTLDSIIPISMIGGVLMWGALVIASAAELENKESDPSKK